MCVIEEYGIMQKCSFMELHLFQAVVETAVTRALLPAPVLIIPPIIMSFLEKYSDMNLAVLFFIPNYDIIGENF